MFLPGDAVLEKTHLELKPTYGFTGNIHHCSDCCWIEALFLMDGRFVVLFDKCMQRHSSLKHNETDEFTETCFNFI